MTLGRLLALTSVAALDSLVPIGCAAQTAAPASTPVRVEGEYGLWVTHTADSIRAAWLTRTESAGFAELEVAGGAKREVRTPSGRAHAASFAHRGGGTVTLRFGSRSDRGDRHETALRLDPPRRPPVSLDGVDSLFVIGDIHGEFDTLVAVLRNAKVIDGRNRWSAGRAQLAVLGDMVDRGPDATRVLWFLYGLEPQAESAGGRLDVVLGNHEIMVMLADLRYTHAKENAIAAAHGVRYDQMFNPRRSILGGWLASKPSLMRVDDALLAHGGVSTDYLGFTLQQYDDSLRAYVSEELFERWVDTTYASPRDSVALARWTDFLMGERSVFWYRGYAQTDTLGAALDSVLARFGSRTHVVGHTPGRTIQTRYGGKLVDVNTAPFAAEVLLLVRTGETVERWRYRTRGAPAKL
jgi:hypothetical protein